MEFKFHVENLAGSRQSELGAYKMFNTKWIKLLAWDTYI